MRARAQAGRTVLQLLLERMAIVCLSAIPPNCRECELGLPWLYSLPWERSRYWMKCKERGSRLPHVESTASRRVG